MLLNRQTFKEALSEKKKNEWKVFCNCVCGFTQGNEKYIYVGVVFVSMKKFHSTF